MWCANQGCLENSLVDGEMGNALDHEDDSPSSGPRGGGSRPSAASTPAVHDCFYSGGSLQLDATQRDVESWLSERCPKAGFRIVLLVGADIPRYTVLINRSLHISRESAQGVWRNLVQAAKSRWAGVVELPAALLGMP